VKDGVSLICDLRESYRPFSGDEASLPALVSISQASLRQCLNGPRKPVVCRNLTSDARGEKPRSA